MRGSSRFVYLVLAVGSGVVGTAWGGEADAPPPPTISPEPAARRAPDPPPNWKPGDPVREGTPSEPPPNGWIRPTPPAPAVSPSPGSSTYPYPYPTPSAQSPVAAVFPYPYPTPSAQSPPVAAVTSVAVTGRVRHPGPLCRALGRFGERLSVAGYDTIRVKIPRQPAPREEASVLVQYQYVNQVPAPPPPVYASPQGR